MTTATQPPGAAQPAPGVYVVDNRCVGDRLTLSRGHDLTLPPDLLVVRADVDVLLYLVPGKAPHLHTEVNAFSYPKTAGATPGDVPGLMHTDRGWFLRVDTRALTRTPRALDSLARLVAEHGIPALDLLYQLNADELSLAHAVQTAQAALTTTAVGAAAATGTGTMPA